MFAGTFFWFRSYSVYTRPAWRYVPQDRYGAEAWLSGMFQAHECKSVYQIWPETVYPTPNPYRAEIYPAEDQQLWQETFQLRLRTSQ
jgi:hypothetical protein